MSNTTNSNIQLSTTINAPVKTVWHKMLDLESYKIWTEVFASGSFYKGSFDLGSKILFSSDMGGGIEGVITQNKYLQILTIAYDGGWIDKDDNKITTTKPAGSSPDIEQYTFTTIDENTTKLDIYVDTSPEYHDDMAQMWPKALEKLKEMCEN